MDRVLRGPLITACDDRSLRYIPDAALACDERARIAFVGAWSEFAKLNGTNVAHRVSRGLILPVMFDLHTHVPQHPIRGQFTKDVATDDPRGKLLAGLEKNVYPAEIAYADDVERVTRDFIDDTRRLGVVGGCAFLTSNARAARRALEMLPATWSAGMVLMDQNCPDALKSSDRAIAELDSLAADFGSRCVVTDRFAVATTSPLRRAGAEIAQRHGLLAQTHLNEQVAEKRMVERELYPNAASYTHVYFDDGLLDTRAVLAHCIQMTDAEWDVLVAKRCVVAHCPSSNEALGSGTMRLDDVISRGIDYAICTDVGAGPSCSLLAEMQTFLRVHAGRSRHATASEALYCTTIAPAKVLGLDRDYGSLSVGRRFAFCETSVVPDADADAESVMTSLLARDDLEQVVVSVTPGE